MPLSGVGLGPGAHRNESLHSAVRNPESRDAGRELLQIRRRVAGKERECGPESPRCSCKRPADERAPSLSPDGRWLVYGSDESGTFQVYVRAFPDKGGKWQISNGGGAYPTWSRTGHDLFFETLDNHIMAASYTLKGDSFVPDKVRM
jgi:WD40-like Beta Propeller Repeat